MTAPTVATVPPAKMDSAVDAEVPTTKTGRKLRRMTASAAKTPPKHLSAEPPRVTRRAEAKTEGSAGGDGRAGQIRGGGGAGEGRGDRQARAKPADHEGDPPEERLAAKKEVKDLRPKGRAVIKRAAQSAVLSPVAAARSHGE